MSRDMTKPTKWHEHPPRLIRVFASRMKKAWVLSYPLSAQRRLWSDWADAQADLSLRWVQMPFCWFCHGAAQIHLHSRVSINVSHLFPEDWLALQVRRQKVRFWNALNQWHIIWETEKQSSTSLFVRTFFFFADITLPNLICRKFLI